MTGGVVGYAFVLGMIGLLNPCGFPLLPVYLSTFVDDGRGGWARRSLGAMRAGLLVTVGFLAVFAAAGTLVGAVRGLIGAVAPWIMVIVGIGIVVLGSLALGGRTVSVLRAPQFRSGRSVLAMTGFGIAYAVGSLSCSLPVFAAAIGGALATGSPLAVLATVLAYGLGMGLFATVIALLASWADVAIFHAVRPFAAVLPRAAGALCVVIGFYVTVFWTGQVSGRQLTQPVTVALDRLQGAVASAIEAAWLPIGVGLVVLVMGVLVVMAIRERRTAAVAASVVGQEEGHRSGESD
ncbi:cytochrome c biogenesis CcdA family protein [Microbacterium sp. 22242]|uniref:cytochrome c biogenesis CcdA family protein n=1 Tax=Microbacterium sp. 22242 TaxID=3453896 RepID=UPI003F86F0D6